MELWSPELDFSGNIFNWNPLKRDRPDFTALCTAFRDYVMILSDWLMECLPLWTALAELFGQTRVLSQHLPVVCFDPPILTKYRGNAAEITSRDLGPFSTAHQKIIRLIRKRIIYYLILFIQLLLFFSKRVHFRNNVATGLVLAFYTQSTQTRRLNFNIWKCFSV